jgi:hypothetical protein
MSHLYASVLRAYLIWVCIIVINSIWKIATSNFYQEFGGEVFASFVNMYVLFGAIVLLIGGILAWQSDAGKGWAFWLFVIFCSWRAIDSVYSLLILEPKRDISFVFVHIVFMIGWALLAVIAWKSRKLKQAGVA